MSCRSKTFRTFLQRNAILLALFAWIHLCVGAEPPAGIDFNRDIQPIFQKYCYDCHGAGKQKSGFRLDIAEYALKGGSQHAPDILPGNADGSPLLRLIRGQDPDPDLVMPPKGKRLTQEEISRIKAWIDAGAKWPSDVSKATARSITESAKHHWAFMPLPSSVPTVLSERSGFARRLSRDWPRNPIDRFIIQRLEQESLSPAPEADRTSWLRRVYLDLIGLPPTPEAVEAFLTDRLPDANERVVNRLLDSPAYGERWAQLWLDVVRYADTHGFEVNTERPNAWPYRDYVIQSFNRDLPYNQFVREQIAGDALMQDAATGFLITASVLLPGQIGADAPSMRLARQDSLDEILINVSQTFLGLSLGCARCHDHKFEPFSQRDYYSMQSFFSGVEYGERPLRTPEADHLRHEADSLKDQLRAVDQSLLQFIPVARSGSTRPPLNSRANTDRISPTLAKRLRFTILKTNNLEPCIDELEVFDDRGMNIARASAGTSVTSSGDTVVPNRHELRQINDGLYGNSHSWMSNEKGKGWVVLELPKEQIITRIVWSRDRDGEFTDRLAIDYRIEAANSDGEWQLVADSSDRKPYTSGEAKPVPFFTENLPPQEASTAKALLDKKRSLESRIKIATHDQLAFTGKFHDPPDPINILNRGNPEQPKDSVVPAVPSILSKLALPATASDQKRRITLADWIADAANPLTARVMVNRLWQGHFGTGLVDTPNDFGLNGARPSHPELLDWLASEFIRSGWSIKHIHRLIVLSATYHQSTRIDASAMRKDADCRLLWRFPSRRTDAEVIRDSILQIAGHLNLTPGGPGFDLFDKRGGLTGFNPVEVFRYDGLRRMVYAHKVRRERDAVFGAFDCPDAGQATTKRRESTTPIQALNLLNSRFMIDQSNTFARRVKSLQPSASTADQVRTAYRLALARPPTRPELIEAVPITNEFGLSALCRALFNSNEFLFLP